MKPQGHRTIPHGQITDTPGSAIFDPLAASLAAGTNEVRVAALEMQFQLVGSDDLVSHAEFWQFEPGLDTLKIHASGSSWGVMVFPAFCEESGMGQYLLEPPYAQYDTLTSILAKSRDFWAAEAKIGVVV